MFHITQRLTVNGYTIKDLDYACKKIVDYTQCTP